MNSFFPIGGAEWWQNAGWTMLHFLWLGTLVGLAAMVCRLLGRRASAEARYATAFVSFALLAALPLGIAAWLGAHAPVETRVAAELPQVDEIIELHGGAAVPISESAPGSAGDFETNDAVTQNSPVSDVVSTNPRPSRGLTDAFMTMPAAWVPYLPWLWLVGTPLTFLLLATGIVGAERLRRDSRVIDEGPIVAACARLRQSLGVSRRVAVAVCERIAAPVLVGILRPIILLPPSALTGWSPEEIEMVLLHELAHVRRWDNLLNLVQRLIESLLFFHPAVWLVSGWVRREREACCDSVVVHCTNRPHAYAEMLVALAAQMPRSVLFHPAATSAMAAGPLRARIRRILQLEDDPMLVSGKSFAMVLGGLLVAGTLTVLYLPAIGQAEESTTDITKSATEKVESEKVEAVVDGEPSGRVQVEQVRVGDENVTVVRGPQDDVDAFVKQAAADDWLAGVAFASPEDAVISRRAWKELGLKIVPASEAELQDLRKGGLRAGLKLHDFEGIPNLEGPYLLMTIQTKGSARGIVSFENLEKALDAIASLPADEIIVLSGFAKNRSVFQYSMRRPQASAVAKPESNSPFPSLEDQKLADLAWKMLQLELEPIKDDELKRVKAMGYDGGVRVVKSPMYSDGIWTDDILVGLHVWPTTSLKDVASVLNRDDLDELNPLKFYVQRRNSGVGENEPGGGRVLLVTGRVSANTSGRGFGGRGQNEGRGGFRGGMTIETHASAPAAEAIAIEGVTPRSAVVDKANLRYDGKPFEEWKSIWRNELSDERRLDAIKALAAFAKAGYGSEATDAIIEVAGQYDFRTRVDSDSAEWKLRTQIVGSLATGAGIDPTAVFKMILERYSAAPDKWHGLLARFLRRAPIIDASVLDQIRKLLAHDSGDIRAGSLAAVVANDPAATSNTVKAALVDPDPQVVSLALLLVDEQEQARKTNEEGAKHELVPSFEFPVDEFVELLLRTPSGRRDRDGNWTAFTVMNRLSTETAERLTDRLIEVLKDPARKADHLAAVRAIGTIGKKAKAARPDVERILNDDSADMSVRIASSLALDSFDGRFGEHGQQLIPRRQAPQQVDEKELKRRRAEQEEIQRLLIEEQNLLLNR